MVYFEKKKIARFKVYSYGVGFGLTVARLCVQTKVLGTSASTMYKQPIRSRVPALINIEITLTLTFTFTKTAVYRPLFIIVVTTSYCSYISNVLCLLQFKSALLIFNTRACLWIHLFCNTNAISLVHTYILLK